MVISQIMPVEHSMGDDFGLQVLLPDVFSEPVRKGKVGPPAEPRFRSGFFWIGVGGESETVLVSEDIEFAHVVPPIDQPLAPCRSSRRQVVVRSQGLSLAYS